MIASLLEEKTFRWLIFFELIALALWLGLCLAPEINGTCKDFSYEEAQIALKKGNTLLDRNNDGIACNI